MKKLAWILVIVGALNWGLVGLGFLFSGANWSLVEMIFGQGSAISAIVYVLVGVSAVISLTGCKACKNGSCMTHKSMPEAPKTM